MKTIISIIVGLAVVIGLYFAVKSHKPQEAVSTSEASMTSSSSQMTAVAPAKKIPFSEFIKQGGSYKCSVNQYLAGLSAPSTKGTIYLDDTMVRAEYSAVIQNNPVSATLLVRDDYSYLWTSMSPSVGYKMKATIIKNPSGTAPATGSYAFNADQVGDYDCQAWKADASLFVVPKTVTFKEM